MNDIPHAPGEPGLYARGAVFKFAGRLCPAKPVFPLSPPAELTTDTLTPDTGSPRLFETIPTRLAHQAGARLTSALIIMSDAIRIIFRVPLVINTAAAGIPLFLCGHASATP